MPIKMDNTPRRILMGRKAGTIQMERTLGRRTRKGTLSRKYGCGESGHLPLANCVCQWILTHHLKVLETTRLHVPEKVNVKMYTDYAGFACLPEEIGDDEYLDDGLGV